jgi:hypothetical protein
MGFGAGLEKLERKHFFFEKKKQKTFINGCGGTRPTRAPDQIFKSLFASFSSEKEDSYLLLCTSRAPCKPTRLNVPTPGYLP